MSYGYERIRYELKYPVGFDQASAFLRDLAPHLVPDSHGDAGRYVVYSTYFDTRTLTCYYEKLDGFAGRIKFRLRTYPGAGRPQWFLESKERVRHYIAKHRVRVSPEQADRLLATHLSPATLDGIVPPDHPLAVKLAPLLRHGVLYPTVAVYYRRNAYVFHGARDVRITLDHNLVALPGRTPTDRLPGVLPVHPRDRLLIEVKGNGWMPIEVMDAICRQGLVARAFSKYCACVEQAYHLPASA